MFLEARAGQDAKNKRLIVEVGHGVAPFPLEGRRTIKENEIYVGVDLFDVDDYLTEENRQKARKLFNDDYSDRNKGLLTRVKADGRQLPFKNNSVDEIVFCHVFSDPNIDDQRRGLMKAARRALKKDGQITVVESDSTEMGWMPVDKLAEEMALFGGMECDNRWAVFDRNEVRNYTAEISPDRPYVVKFKKAIGGKLGAFISLLKSKG